jgi:hypothetical protein
VNDENVGSWCQLTFNSLYVIGEQKLNKLGHARRDRVNALPVPDCLPTSNPAFWCRLTANQIIR